LVIKGKKIIQGIISLERAGGYIEMPLIESAPHNIGRNKKYYGVPANLVAFACKMSFESGFEGYVAFTSKTRLITHYQQSLGAKIIFRERMEIDTESAKILVNLYFKGFLNG
jgi:hypothetical protein